MKRVFPVVTLVLLALLLVVTGCSKPAPASAAQAPAAQAPAAKAPVSDNSQDLKVDLRVNLAQEDAQNYFSFAGNIRYLAADKDRFDAVAGASAKNTTEVLNAYLYDVEGKTTFASGLRGLFLFGVNPYSQLVADDLNASKAADGTITIQYAHRGTAYRIKTDSSGKLSFPNGSFEQRTIGYIIGAGPQVISQDFSADGTAATIDWAKVWDSSVAGGKVVNAAQPERKTGNIVKAGADPASMYFFDGSLATALENNVLTINGFLTAVRR